MCGDISIERHVAPLLVHGKPRTAIGGVEDGVPGAACERDRWSGHTEHPTTSPVPTTSIVVSTGTMTRDSQSFKRGAHRYLDAARGG